MARSMILALILVLLMTPSITGISGGMRATANEVAAILTLTEFRTIAERLSLIYYEDLGLIPQVIYLDRLIRIGPDKNFSPRDVKQVITELYESGIRRFTILADGDLIPPAPYEWDSYYSDIDGDNEPDAIIGRIPISTLSEGFRYLRKVRTYLSMEPPEKILFIGGRFTTRFPEGAQFIENALGSNPFMRNYPADKFYYVMEEGKEDPVVLAKLMNESRYWLVLYSGHGSPWDWYIASSNCHIPKPSFNSTLARNLVNGFPFIAFSDGCNTAKFVKFERERIRDVNSIAEALLFAPGGAIAYIGGTEEVFISPEYVARFIRAVSESPNNGVRTIGDAFFSMIRSPYHHYLIWVLLGDPNLPLKKPNIGPEGNNMAKKVKERTSPLRVVVYDPISKRFISNATVKVDVVHGVWGEVYGGYNRTLITRQDGSAEFAPIPTLLRIRVEKDGYYPIETLIYGASPWLKRAYNLLMFPRNTSYAILFIDKNPNPNVLSIIMSELQRRGITVVPILLEFRSEQYYLFSQNYGHPEIVIWYGEGGRYSRYQCRITRSCCYSLMAQMISDTSRTVKKALILADPASFYPDFNKHVYHPKVGLIFPENGTYRKVEGALYLNTSNEYLPRKITLISSERIYIPTIWYTGYTRALYVDSEGRPVIFSANNPALPGKKIYLINYKLSYFRKEDLAKLVRGMVPP